MQIRKMSENSRRKPAAAALEKADQRECSRRNQVHLFALEYCCFIDIAVFLCYNIYIRKTKEVFEMNTREFAKKNGKRAESVRERCKEGMLPTAVKRKNGRWDIPEDAEMPPCTGREAAMLIENILENAGGREVRLVPARMMRRGEAALRYLSNWGFISESGEGRAPVVLERGLELAARFGGAVSSANGSKTAEKRTSLGIKAKLELKLPIGSALAEVDYSRERAEGEKTKADEKAG